MGAEANGAEQTPTETVQETVEELLEVINFINCFFLFRVYGLLGWKDSKLGVKEY